MGAEIVIDPSGVVSCINDAARVLLKQPEGALDLRGVLARAGELGLKIEVTHAEGSLVLRFDDGAEGRKWRTLLEHSSEGMVVVDENNTIREVTGPVEKIIGFTREELIDRPATHLLHPDEKEALVKHETMVRSPDATTAYVTRNRHKDGTWRYIEAYAANLLSNPDVRAVVANFRDVTERIETDERLRRSEASFRALVDHMPTPVFVQRDFRITYANRAHVRLLGFDRPEEIVGRSLLDFAPVEDKAFIEKRVATIRTSKYNPRVERELVRRDGSRVSVEIEALEVELADGPSILVLAHDLSERKALLARMAAADRMLSVATLAAGVGHEINGPLAYILTNLTVLSEELPRALAGRGRLDEASILRLVHDVLEGATRVRDVVRDLRTLTREDGTTETTDLAAVLESCVKMAWHEVSTKARVVQDLKPTPSVAGSPSRLGQVFLNLLFNAAQAIPVGNPQENEIRVSTRVLDDGRVMVEISDTGQGIPDSIKAHIFDPFFTTKEQGGGMGLAICQAIVTSVGGEIAIQNREEKGSSFQVILPEREMSSVRDATPRPKPVAARARVLVIDDEPAMGQSLRWLLADHEVISFTRASEALERIQTGERFDLVLCDLMMPEMTGVALYETIARIAPELASRVVFLTGGALTPEARAFVAKHARTVVEKPFEPQALAALVERYAS